MDKAIWTQLERDAEVMKALGHPTRLFIVKKLSEREHCVCELTEMIGCDMSTVSRHLAQLKNVGIIESEKRAQQVIYRLRYSCAANFISCIESVLTASGTEGVR